MPEDHVSCQLCGQCEFALFDHIRDYHKMSIPEYERRFPAAPLFSDALAECIVEQDIVFHDGSVKVQRKLFNVPVKCDLLPDEHVPAIDDDYCFDEKLAKPVMQSIVENDRILLVGGTGCGKSSLVCQIAARTNWPVRRVNLHGETSVSDFVGQWVVEGGEMRFRYGVLPSAMKAGHILVLEELDAAEPAILFILQGVMEQDGVLVLAENGGEIIKPHPRFRMVATANTLGLGDETGLYTGTHVLNASHLDRWTAVFNMSYLPEEQEESLLLTKVPSLDQKMAKALVKLANAVRKAAEQEQVFCTFSTRRLLFLGRKIASLKSLNTALEVTVLNKLAKNDRQVVYELAQRHLPELENGNGGST